MNRIVVVVTSLVLAGVLPASAPAATRHWRVVADVTGGYANDVTSTAPCAAHYREQVTGVRMRFASIAPLSYDTEARALTGKLRYVLTGGTWTVTGSYVPLAPQPDGTLDCAAAPDPVDCTAKVVAEDGHRVRTSGAARMAVDDNTRGAVVSRLDGPRLTEQFADAGTPPAGWPPACRVTGDEESVPATAYFGLASTGIADRQLQARIPIPAAKLAGRRRFTVRVPSSKPSGCPAQGFDPCTEQGGFGTRVTFTPA
jgi:hypothetical protein